MSLFDLSLTMAALVGALCGGVGAFVVMRRRVFFASALTHASYPGGVAAALVGAPIALGALVSSVLLMLVMLGLMRVRRQGEQVATGIVMSIGFAGGTALMGAFPSLGVRIDTFLVGSIALLQPADVLLAAAALAVVAIVMALAWQRLVFSTIDVAGYRAAGFRPAVADLLVLALIVVTVVTTIPAIGAILMIALIAGPATAVRPHVRSPLALVLGAALVGVACAVGGVLIAHALNIAAGGTIAIVCALVVVLSLGVTSARSWRGRATPRPRARIGVRSSSAR